LKNKQKAAELYPSEAINLGLKFRRKFGVLSNLLQRKPRCVCIINEYIQYYALKFICAEQIRAFRYKLVYMKGSPGATVKLLPCDHEVMGSSPENNLLQKCRERLHT
jgi:hypothetical protein